MRYKSLHKTLRFGEDLAAAQQEMLAKNLAKAALAKAREDAKLAPKRLKRIRAQERARYAEHKAQDAVAIKAEELALKEERKQKREAKRAEREKARFIEHNRGTFTALGLTTSAEQNVFLKVREIYPAVLVSRLAQGGFVQPECVSEALDYLRTASAPHLV